MTKAAKPKKLTAAKIQRILDAEPGPSQEALGLDALVALMWPKIRDLLEAYGVPAAHWGLVKLRDYLDAKMKPGIGRVVVLRALDALIASTEAQRILGVDTGQPAMEAPAPA